MSERNGAKIMKSLSEGEMLEREEGRLIGDGSQRSGDMSSLKRTFTLPRNPFSWSSSARPGKTRGTFRRPSWRRLLSRVVRHVTSRGGGKAVGGPVATVPADRVPGVTGLRNHGNTCFINAVLQCLSHTDVLAEYFVLNQYKQDLGRRRRGTRGEVTEQLAVLLKAIWTCQYEPDISSQFKLVVDKYGSQYRGNNQHDAQEFLLWLLDKVHEDLNTATKRKYKAVKNSFGRPDEVVAAETLANHVRCNNSFVHAVFQAQFRSSLTCPRCHRQSNTFDPFLCMSVPVPQNHRRPLYVTVLYTAQQPRQVKIGVSIQVHAEVRELREVLASDTGISEAHMLLTEVDDTGFHRTFSDAQPVSVLREEDPIYCLELPQLKEVSEDSGAYLLLCWVNVLVLDDHRARFSCPYTMQVCRETSYEDLQKLILKEMNTILHDDVLVNSQEIPLFRMRVLDGLGGSDTYLDPTLDHPLYMEAVEQALALCEDDAGPQHLKLLLEWDLQAKESIIADDSDPMEEHASVKQLKINSEQGGAVTLEECFELYTRAEVLGADDAWHCPSCNRKQEVVKKLGLWSLPDILVIHLKRFRQSKQRASTKLTTLVDFPLSGFDMSPHLASKLVSQGSLGWSPWKRPCRSPPRCDDNVYDLYAVCNHHGQDLQGGHYTAYCRNPYDAQWYCFDDTRVEPVAETNVVTAAAYMLFYQRHGLAGGYSASSAASTSSSGSGADHWVNRMPAFSYSPQHKRSSRSHEELSTTKAEAELKQFPRGGLSYSTLQPAKRSVATETDAAELDHHSDDEAPPVSRQWESTVSTNEPAAENDVATDVCPVITESRV